VASRKWDRKCYYSPYKEVELQKPPEFKSSINGQLLRILIAAKIKFGGAKEGVGKKSQQV